MPLEPRRKPIQRIAAIAALLCLSAAALAQEHPSPLIAPVPESLRVYGEMPPLPGVADLKFREFFKMPIGPRGLEPSDKLLQLDGQSVRLVGFMARQDDAIPGLFILSPLPVHMGDEDDSFSDDLPASAVFVRLSAEKQSTRLPYMPGLLALIGTLKIGAEEEPDGRVSVVRLLLSDPQSRALAEAVPISYAATAR